MTEILLNQQDHSKKKYKYTFRYALAGGLFGLCFPVIGTILESFSSGLPLTVENFVSVQTDSPLLWIINSAPIFLGIFAGMAGIRQDRLSQQISRLKIESLARDKALDELENLKKSLDQEVYDRTLALETSTEVGRRLSTILNQEELVREAVDQVHTAFNYYHAHIYLFDERKEILEMVGGTGTAGRTMLEQEHSVTKGLGLVGKAAETNLPILVEDVSKAIGWLPNPLLPNTKAEVALPIATGQNVLGVLDIQDDKVGSLTEVDVDQLQSIANLVASALQNARSYKRTQEKIARDSLMASINQQIISTTNVESALQVTVRELGRVLGMDTVVKLNQGRSEQTKGQVRIVGAEK